MPILFPQEEEADLSPLILYKDMSQQIYTDGSFTQNGFKGEYYNTRNLTGELFQAAIEPAIDHAWKYHVFVIGVFPESS